MRFIYLVPFNFNQSYLDAYSNLFKKRLKILTGKFIIIKLFFLPYKAKVIIEDIHMYWYVYIIRFDLILYHVPRGGCTFKIGWKDSGCSFRIKLKLWRRDFIVIASDFFSNFFREQEFVLNNQDILICSEPILEINCLNYDYNKAYKTLLILGDRATKKAYEKIINHLSTDIKKNLVVTIHPRLNFEIDDYSSVYSLHEIKNVISDGSVSSILMFSKMGVNIYILNDELHSRPLYLEKSKFYSNMINLLDLDGQLENKKISGLKIDVSTKSLLNEI